MSELDEELEVLESIFPSEVSRLSTHQVEIVVKPDDVPNDLQQEPLVLTLQLTYPDSYPEALPEMELRAEEGILETVESNRLLSSLQRVGEENIGMVLTFTLVSHLKEELATLITDRVESIRKKEAEAERIAIQLEEERTKGTPVTLDSFKSWRDRFLEQKRLVEQKLEDEKLKSLGVKDREEWRRTATRLTGRQLFERSRNLDESDMTFAEDGAQSVDFSEYHREQREDEEEAALQFSDSD